MLERAGTNDPFTSVIEPSHLICAAELASPNLSQAITPTRASGSDYRHDTTTHSVAGPSSSSRPSGQVPIPQRPAPAPWSTHASRSIDGDIGLGVHDRDSPNPNPAPGTLQRSALAQGYPHSNSSTNVMRVSQIGHTHSPPRVSHETQEDKEQRRQRVWGRNLYGNAHISGIRVAAPEGGLGIWFLFTVNPPRPLPDCSENLRADVISTGPIRTA